MTEPVRSPRNPRLVRAGRLRRARERREAGLTLLEGPHLLQEAVRAGVEVVEVFALPADRVSQKLAGEAGFPLVLVEQEALSRIAPTEHPRGPLAVARIPPAVPPRSDAAWLDVADPGNGGTLIRTAAAFGMDVIVAPEGVDPWSPKVVRAAAGAHFRTALSVGPPPSGWGSIAAVVHGGIGPADLEEVLDPERRWAVLIGHEAHGLPARLADEADVRVTIAMPGGTESLNASIAGSILLYELSRWRQAVGTPATPH